MLPTRLRKNDRIRKMVRETKISTDDFIYPVFVTEGRNIKNEIPSMKGQYHYSIDRLDELVQELNDKDIHSVILFGVPSEKDCLAGPAFDEQGIVQQAVRAIKKADPSMYVVCDVCLCEYKSDGHCCFFTENGEINRLKTLDVLAKTALSQVEAGADMVAPSDMMDGHIAAIRTVLDEAGYESIPIMGYSAKYASAFYGPFRDAAGSAPAFGDRRSYQMDPANANEAMKEIALDIEEGVDIVMVKPAMPYLDIIAAGTALTNLPMAAYQVSGEYAMLRTAVDSGLMDERVLYEALLGIKRAGAKLIITYFAPEALALIQKYQDN